jgi:hypothetical protein
VSGASAWISLGALAVTNNELARVGVLPPLWALGACISVGLLAAWLTRLRTDEAWPLALTLLLAAWQASHLPGATIGKDRSS